MHIGLPRGDDASVLIVWVDDDVAAEREVHVAGLTPSSPDSLHVVGWCEPKARGRARDVGFFCLVNGWNTAATALVQNVKSTTIATMNIDAFAGGVILVRLPRIGCAYRRYSQRLVL